MEKNYMKVKLFSWTSRLLILYLIYVLVSLTLPVYITSPDETSYAREVDPERFYGSETGIDRVALIEDRMFSGVSRIHLMDQAEESLKIAYYAVHHGVSSQIFYGTILSAANRGVEVQLIFDGIFHNLALSGKTVYWALVNHPNIEIRFYEPLNMLRPWTFNNRLHDKIMIIDGTYAMSGGRNIGDKYFIDPYDGDIVKDRDVLIYNTCLDRPEKSVINEFELYFDRLWQYERTKRKHLEVPGRHQKSAVEKEAELLENRRLVEVTHPENFPESIDWESVSHETQKISLITNPLARLKQEPRILLEMSALLKRADETVIIQSPYIIPSKNMMRYINYDQTDAELYFLTNSKKSTPNYFGIAGYLNHRDSIAKQADQIFEYNGSGSIHAKSYIFDQRISLVGSFNIDARSAFLSTENMVVIDSESFASELSEQMERLVRQSEPYIDDGPDLNAKQAQSDSVSWYRRLIIRFMRVILYPFNELL